MIKKNRTNQARIIIDRLVCMFSGFIRLPAEIEV